MKKIIYLFILAIAACTQPNKTIVKDNLIPDVPDSIPSIPLSMNLVLDSFPHKVNIEYIGDSVAVSELPSGVQVAVTGADVSIHSSLNGVEYSLYGASENGSFSLVSNTSSLVTFSSLKLISQKKNTVSLLSPKGLFLRSVGNSLSYLMDGMPNDTVYVPKKSATLFIDGNAIISAGNIALRGERKDAVYCTGKLIIDNANIAVEAARTDALSADSGLLVLSGNINAKANKDILKSKKGNVVLCDGCVELESFGEKGDAIQARNIYMYGGNIIAKVNGAASRGINSKAAVYLLGGLLDITTNGDALFSPKKYDYTSGACIKSETHLYINDAFVSLKNNGDGGKGINCNGLMQVDGGTLLVENIGNDLQHPHDYNAHTSAKGIKCDSGMLIRGGLIEVLVYGKGERCEGIEAKYDMTIEGDNTTIYVYAYDDAFNSGKSFVMNGGRVYAYSVANDAVDSNYRFVLNGGLLIATGGSTPEQGIDVDNNSFFTIKGGTLAVVGGTMGPTPSLPMNDDTEQSVVVWNGIKLVRDKFIAVKDENDSLLCAYRIPRNIDGAFTYSSNEIKSGGTYSLIISDTITGSRYFGNGFYVGGTVVNVVDSVTWRQNESIVSLSETGAVMDMQEFELHKNGFPPSPSHGGNGTGFPPPPSHGGNGTGFPPPPSHGGNGTGFPPPPPHGGNGAGFPSPPPHFQVKDLDTEGYRGRNLPGGGWLPGSVK